MFVLTVIISLAIVSMFFPSKGIRISNQITLEFPSIESFFRAKAVTSPALPLLISEADTAVPQKVSTRVLPDSLMIKTIDEVRQPIESENIDTSSLAPFYARLLNNDKIIRVLHYGDSQIEGDRITGYLRQKFQERFGGSGAGYIPVIQTENVALQVALKQQGQWKRYTAYGRRDTTLQTNHFGAYGSFGRFVPQLVSVDSSGFNAGLEITPIKSSYKNCFNISSIKLLSGALHAPLTVRITSGEQIVAEKEYSLSNDVVADEWNIDNGSQSVRIGFKANQSPDLYGILLDGNAPGVAFDNIPMRGSSGTDFTKIDFNDLKQTYEKLDVEMLIYQFGVNVVPNILEDYTFYERWVYDQLTYLRKAKPEIPILVIGISDMSMKDGDDFVSYPNIVKIRDAQKRAAFRAGCAFWDMYLAMGGENSMVAWVNANPPLATQDYTHFNYAGSRIISQLLCKALMADYENYVRTCKP